MFNGYLSLFTLLIYLKNGLAFICKCVVGIFWTRFLSQIHNVFLFGTCIGLLLGNYKITSLPRIFFKTLVNKKPWRWWRKRRGRLRPRTKRTRNRIRAYFDPSFHLLLHFRFGEVLFRLFWVSAFLTVCRRTVQVVVLLADDISHDDFWTRPVQLVKVYIDGKTGTIPIKYACKRVK